MLYPVRSSYRRLRYFLWVSRPEVWIGKGLARGTQDAISIAYAGLKPYKNYFMQTMLEDGYEEKSLGKVWIWSLISTIKRISPECLFLAFEPVEQRSKYLKADEPFIMPVWVRLELSGEAFKQKRKYSVIEKRILKNGLEYETSRDEKDFYEFYFYMYEPHVKKKHGSTTVLHPYEDLRKRFLRGSELLFIKKNGVRIAGNITDYAENIPHLLYMGIRDGDSAHLKSGAADAIYYFSMKRIEEKGYARANLGHCRAFLKDGPLLSKRELGAEIMDSIYQESGCLGIQILRKSPLLGKIWAQHPFIARDKQGRSRVVVFQRERVPHAPSDWFESNQDRPLEKEFFCFDAAGKPEKIRIFLDADSDREMPVLQNGNDLFASVIEKSKEESFSHAPKPGDKEIFAEKVSRENKTP